MPWLIDAPHLDRLRKDQKTVVILDTTWFLPTDEVKLSAKEAFAAEHIVGAHFFDFNDFADPQTDLPNMLIRDEALLKQKIGALGITPQHKIIFYDQSPHHTSSRALWMFKVFGHPDQHLYILDGGLNAWKKYGGKTESRELPITERDYPVAFRPALVRTLVQMKANIHHPKEQVVDLRHPVRFAGGPETRPHMRAGHMPGSFSLPYMSLFDKNGHFKPLEKLRKQLLAIGLDLNAPIVTSCGSGMTAAILNFILDLLDHPNHALYDGSWSEWGRDTLYPGEESLAERPVVTSMES